MASAVSCERRLFGELLDLRSRVHAEAQALTGKWKSHVERPGFDYSAFNLACYLSLRLRDLRELQQALVPLGLSSLGRCESHVLASLDAVIAALAMMCQEHQAKHPGRPSLRHFIRGWNIIE